MSDLMLLGMLRMPMPDEPDPVTFRQFVSRARQAACRIEADADEIAELRARCEVLRLERDRERARVDASVELMTRIHALLYPSPIKLSDGQTMVFRLNDADPHAALQKLSDLIRALPDEMRAVGIDAAMAKEPR